MNLSFKGAAKRLDDIDLPKLGYLMGVGEDEVHAFMDVETRGTGFDSQGRPIILFEPHIFYAQLGKGTKRDRAVKAGLAYASWGAKAYPNDSYPRLKSAMAIDEDAALKSASWGLGQVMGFNHKTAGFQTVQAMIEAMMADEENQLLASVNFIKNAKLDRHLRAHNWASFAAGYNGSGYKANRYDVKLAEAFAKWQRIKNTPWTPPTGKARETFVTPTLRPEPSTAAPQVAEKPNVVLVDGPKKDETQVVIVQTPKNEPATNPLPSSKTGVAAFAAMAGALVIGALKYFGAM